ncbi:MULTISPECIES: hypothetical protein [unclassified Nocardioides]|uniref:hypothetical protein n=1 Tax=unclassified Nocardioides TaxID=2615069 RepID=UPI000702CA7D|nr:MULTISPECIES: hypothetical protein [unclassified Nocardioides]KRC53162.1 hypothetical protein ASE19_12345 [Nocardioides sp. Root79]KRC72690.1 hypothetical protein ASE20_08870 [Nocardioides sp. Root240]
MGISVLTRRPAAFVAAGLLGLSAVAGLTGCGSDEPTGTPVNDVADAKPADALEAARKAMLDLDDVTYRGTVTLAGQSGALKGSAVYTATDDDSCQTTFTNKRQGRLVSRTVGGTTYVRADVAMMRAVLQYDAARAASLKGKWMAAPRLGARECDLADLVPDAGQYDTFEDAGTGEVGGVPVRRFTGKDADGSPSTVSIATEGAPLVLQVRTGPEGASTLTLAERNAGVELPKPPKDKTVNAS